MHLEIIRGVSRKNPAVNINLSPLVGIMIKKDRKNTFKVSVISHIQAFATLVAFQYFCIFIHFKHTIRTCRKIKYKYTIGIKYTIGTQLDGSDCKSDPASSTWTVVIQT